VKVTRFDFEFSEPLSWPLALIGVTPWTAHVDVTDDALTVRFGPWSLATPLSNVEGATVTGPYLPFKVLGPHVSLADRGVTFGTSWHQGVCVRFRRPVAGALPTGLLKHPAATVTVAEPEQLAALLERAPSGAPGEGDELHAVLQAVPDLATAAGGGTDAGSGVPTPVATPPATRSSSSRPTAPRPARAASAGTGTGNRTRPTGTGSRTRPTGRKRSAPPPEAHPTPADMPEHTETEKAPGVTPPADQDLPGPDDTTT
jgi:hypothetical protein